MSDRRFTPRSASITIGSIRVVVAALLAIVVGGCLLFGSSAGAQEPEVPQAESAGEIPVTLGRPGNVYPDNGWFDSGPAVPLMAFGTVVMLGVGASIIVGRCRQGTAD